MTEQFLEPTQESGAAFFMRNLQGPVIMLNLLRFRDVADYSASLELAPATPISGREAYDRYMAWTAPFLAESGGEVIFLGDGGRFLIGPQTERWDLVMMVRQSSAASFLVFAQNEEYLKGIGHRTAALEDSRLLSISESE